MLRKRKLIKQRLKFIVEDFNQKPLKQDWLRFAVEAGLIVKNEPLSADTAAASSGSSGTNNVDMHGIINVASLAQFLKCTAGLGRTQIGEFISKGPPEVHPFHAKVLKEYTKTFDFKGMQCITRGSVPCCNTTLHCGF